MHRIVLAAALLLGGQAIAQILPSPQPVRLKTLDDIDEAIRQLKQVAWAIPEALGHPATDAAGRRVEDDLAEYFLTESALGKIGSLRDGIAALGGPSATIPPETVRPLQQLMASEQCRSVVIWAYWSRRKAYEQQRETIEQVILKLPEPDRPAATQELRSFDGRDGQLRTQLAPGVQFCQGIAVSTTAPAVTSLPAMLDSRDALSDGYSSLRTKLAAKVAAARAASGVLPEWTHRSKPCPEPATTTSGTHSPKVRSSPDIRDYYPREAIIQNIGGDSRVNLEYDATGCVVAAVVSQSTGSDLLDAASLNIAFDYVLTPGEVDGKSSGGVVVLPINFSVRNVPLDAPPVVTQSKP